MIHVTRGPKPASLRRNAPSWTLELCAARQLHFANIERYNRDEISTLPRLPEAKKRRYAATSIKNALKQMFGTKCCYCEATVDAVSYRHVEHFRPQSLYPALAYEWANLLFACERCNSTHKRDRFPIGPDEHQPEINPQDPCDNNPHDGMLLDPCVDEPGHHFGYGFSDLGSAGLDVILICKTRRAEITRDVCGLDRDELSDERKMWLARVRDAVWGLVLAEAAHKDDKRAVFISSLRYFASPAAPYSAMARAYINKTLPGALSPFDSP